MSEEIQNKIATTVAATPKNLKPIDTVRHDLEKMKSQFQMVLPKHLTPERLLRVALTACQQTPKLLNCDRKSLYSAIMRSAQLGLEPDGVLGQAYLIPFGDKVTFIVGYKGLIDLARRTGEVTSIFAKEVCANDHFEYRFGLEEKLEHIPADGERGEVKYFYAVAKFKDGGYHFDVMTKSEVETIRDKGQGKNNAVWKDHFIEMGKKTAIRRIAKYLPMSVQKASLTEDLIDAGKQFHANEYGDIIIDGDAEEVKDQPKLAGNEGVKAALKKKAVNAGANPETGEIVEQTQPEPEAKPEPMPEYSTKLIPVGVVDGDASKSDFEGWKLAFMKACNSAPSLVLLSEFYTNNVKILNQVKTRAPVFYEECERTYQDNCARLQS